MYREGKHDLRVAAIVVVLGLASLHFASAAVAAEHAIPFCARALEPSENAARTAFLQSFGLDLRRGVDVRGRRLEEIPFCGTFTADAVARHSAKDGLWVDYAITGMTINTRDVGLDPYPKSRVEIRRGQCGGTPDECIRVIVSANFGAVSPKAYPALSFELEATMPARTLTSSALPSNTDFLSLARSTSSGYFHYYIRTGTVESHLQADTEWDLPNAEAPVEFDGPEVTIQNLRAREMPPLVASQLTKTLVVDCATDPAGLTHVLNLRRHLSARSEKQALTWSSSRDSVDSPETYSVPCPEVPGKVSITTVDVAHARNPLLSDRLFVMALGRGTRDAFDEWYGHESLSTQWLQQLPPPPARLLLDASTGEPTQVPDGWELCSPSSYCPAWPNRFHPGAVYQIRSRYVPGGHGHQATYDDEGQMITDAHCTVTGPAGFPCVAAGSADRSHPDLALGSAHLETDVLPFLWAAQLDGNPVMGWPANLLPLDLTSPLVRVGDHLRRYFQMRPTLPTGTTGP